MAELSREAKALLDTIAGPESRGKYDVIYGGSRFTDFSGHPRKYVTITSGPNKGKKSSAAGKFQILGSTYDAYAPKAGVTDFTPASQDAVAWEIAKDEYRRDTGRSLEADLAAGDISRVPGSLRNQWTSLPGGIEQGIGTNAFAKAYNANLGYAAPVPAQRLAGRGGGGIGGLFNGVLDHLGNAGQGALDMVGGTDMLSAYAPDGMTPPAVQAAEGLAAAKPQTGGIGGMFGGVLDHAGKLGRGAIDMMGGGGLLESFGNILGPPAGKAIGYAAERAAPIMRSAGASIVPNLMGSVAGRTILGKHLMAQNIAPAPTMVPGHQSGGTQAMAVNRQGSRPVTLMRPAQGRGSRQSQAFDNDHHAGQNMDVYRSNRAAMGGPVTQALVDAALNSGRTLVKRPSGSSSGGGSYSSGVPQSLIG